MAAVDLTAQRLRELLHYDPETGVFIWRNSARGRMRAGNIAGCVSDGYRVIRINNQSFRGHRLAWLHERGAWPAFDIDHINGDRGDNRIANLRLSIGSINQENIRSYKGAVGLLGVTFHRVTGKFQASLSVSRKRLHIGLFETAEEAHAAYLTAKREMHVGCTI